MIRARHTGQCRHDWLDHQGRCVHAVRDRLRNPRDCRSIRRRRDQRRLPDARGWELPGRLGFDVVRRRLHGRNVGMRTQRLVRSDEQPVVSQRHRERGVDAATVRRIGGSWRGGSVRLAAGRDRRAWTYLGASAHGAIFAGSPHGRMYALDARTGTPAWSAAIGTGPTTVFEPISAGPAVVAAFTTFDAPNQGGIVSLDRRTGRERWRHAFTAPDGRSLAAAGGPRADRLEPHRGILARHRHRLRPPNAS